MWATFYRHLMIWLCGQWVSSEYLLAGQLCKESDKQKKRFPSHFTLIGILNIPMFLFNDSNIPLIAKSCLDIFLDFYYITKHCSKVLTILLMSNQRLVISYFFACGVPSYSWIFRCDSICRIAHVTHWLIGHLSKSSSVYGLKHREMFWKQSFHPVIKDFKMFS